jgi:hypothetical protein
MNESDSPQPVASTPEPTSTPSDGTRKAWCTLTDAEREAVAYFATFHGSPREADAKHGKTLLALLERTRNGTLDGRETGQ